jgi:hypothetical protein
MMTVALESDSSDATMAGGTWKRECVAAGYLSERSHFIPDRPRQLEVLLRVVRSTEQPPSRICGVIAGKPDTQGSQTPGKPDTQDTFVGHGEARYRIYVGRRPEVA